jgi:hypothetical protein
LVEKAWESSARTLSHFSANDALEKEVITVWKGSQNLLSGGIIWRGWGGVNERPGIARPSFLLAERARWDGARPMRAVKDSLPTPYGELTGRARRPQSKAPHTLAWLGIELEKSVRVDARSEGQPGHCLTRMIHNGSSRNPRECVPCKAYLVFPRNVQCVILDVQLNNQH